MKLAIAHGFTLMALALAVGVPASSAAQGTLPPGFTPQSFALLKQRAEAGDQKAQELYKKVLASNSALGEAVKNSAEALGALDSAKAEIEKSEASTGILTGSMLKEATDAFVVNGFFVGMPLTDAHARLANLLPGRKVSRRPPGGTLSEATQRGLEGLWIDGSDEAFCLAENGRVVRLLIPGPLVVDWLGLQSSSHDARAEEIARKFGYVDVFGLPIIEIVFFSVPGLVEVYSFQIAEYLVSVPDVDKENFEKSGYGKGHALQFNQRLYRLGKESRVSYFGKASGSSDIGETKQGRNPYFDGWLKNIRALGENASEGTLRIDAPNYKIPDKKFEMSADDSPPQQPAEDKEGAKDGAETGGVFEGASRTKGALPGLFGVKFGLTMPAEQSCETNNLFSLAYTYVPEKAFNEFTDYVIFASPKTRTIYQVRGIHHCETRTEAQTKIAEIAPTLEMKFGRRLQNDGDGRIMRFPGGDRIEVTVSQREQGYSVLIDAVSSAYDVRDTQESMALKDDFAKSLVAPLGKTLDEVLPPAAARPVNADGDYLMPIPDFLRSGGFKEMALHLLPNTKRIDFAYATCSDRATSCSNLFDRTTSNLQLVFGPVVKEEVVTGEMTILLMLFGVKVDDVPGRGVDFTTSVSGSPYRFQLVQSLDGNRVLLGVEDINAGKADAEKAAASDLDAL